MADRLRAFLALCLPERAVDIAALVQEELVDRFGEHDVKWVAPENLHITLRFFGDLDRSQVDSVRELMHQMAGNGVKVANSNRCGLDTGWADLGVFPNSRRPSVIWLGLRDDSFLLAGLAASVNEQLESAGFGSADKPFKAHVTLGRVRRGRTISWQEVSNRLTIPREAFSIRQIVLIKSLLTPQGPVYTPIETAQLCV
jgi:RNA 2',3'-cyclic 3'-phosphodiesterase